MAEKPAPSPLAEALGRIPTGLYVVSTLENGQPLAFIGSFLMQVGFEPPTVCVAIGRDRAHLAAVRASGRFAVSILDAASQGLMGHFFKGYPEGETAFDHIENEPAPGGPPILSESLAWFDCRFSGEYDAGDHIVVFGVVEEGQCLRAGDPVTHLRKNGLGY